LKKEKEKEYIGDERGLVIRGEEENEAELPRLQEE
jgi:hypothetical protein